MKGYPVDIVTENIRFLSLMQKVADKKLNAAQRAKFAEIAGQIFAGYYPLK